MITSTAIGGNAVDTITLKNQKTAATATLTNTVSKALTVNVDGVGYNAAGATVVVTAVAGAAAETITVNATGAKSNVTVSAAAKTLNITGTADLVLAPVATATKIDGSTATDWINTWYIKCCYYKCSNRFWKRYFYIICNCKSYS